MTMAPALPNAKVDAEPSPSAILLVFLLYVAGTTCNWGFLSWWGLPLVLSAAALAFWFHARPRWDGPPPEAMLTGIFIACVAANCWLQTGQSQSQLARNPGQVYWPQYLASERLTASGIAIKLLAAVALLLAASYLSRCAGWIARRRFAGLILIAVALRILMLSSTPSPGIDVFVSQSAAGSGLLEGKNVYTMQMPSPYEPGKLIPNYGYPPSVIYCNGVSWLLFKDVRAVWVICDVLAALLMYLLAWRFNPGEKGRRLCQLLPLTFLFLPRSLFVIEQSWTEPLVVVSLAGFALAAASGRSPALIGALLGLWLSSKQYVVLAIPAVLKLRRWRATTWICAIAVGLALALPFAIWDFAAMKANIFDFFVKSEGRADALSLYGLLLALRVQLSAAVTGVVVALLWIGGIAWFTWKMPRNLAGMLFAAAGMWIFFFLLGKQAFANYFYLVAFTLLLAVAASPQAAAGDAPECGVQKTA
jgi:hypothetical protein